MIKIPFDNTYIKLPEKFYSTTNPTPVDKPELFQFNSELAASLGIKGVDPISLEASNIFSGNEVLKGSEPISMAYAGHQFGGFSPQLGDGRAILLGEIIDPNGSRVDLQLKGSGRTPWSRGGDGRSALGPVIREYLVSEAMAKLGVPTTRALAAVTTGEAVARNTLVPGGILTRVASGFVRVGTFQYFSARKDIDAIKQLADYVIDRHYPEAKDADNPYAALLTTVLNKQAKLIAHWISIGFIHGVMNTDNMSITGETIDYGPCAFMDEFSHDRVYSSIDQDSRYAYNNQPKMAQWNLVRFAETLLPLLIKDDDDPKPAVEVAQDILNPFSEQYNKHKLEIMRKKLGFSEAHEDDATLIAELFDLMEINEADFTLTFHYLSQEDSKDKLTNLFLYPDTLNKWLIKWQERLAKESLSDEDRQAMMNKVNPVYIPRNHLVEAAIRSAEDNNNFSVFNELHEVLQNPFALQEGKDKYLMPPKPEEVVHQTFCGT